MSIGVILVNLGTPAKPDIKSVRAYLAEFLSDPRVIDLPSLVRYVLLYLFILPFRPKKSLEAYKKVWLPGGSPLRIYGESLVSKVQTCLGSNYTVKLAMRYGDPSIETALSSLQDCDRLIVLPLFPQYASATTGSVVAKIYEILSSKQYITPLNILPEFYVNNDFVASYALNIRLNVDLEKIDKLVFSFHGLPVRQIEKGGCKVVCATAPCPEISPKNYCCYRAQCYATARAIAKELDFDKFSVAFQSRLGRTPWIKPYTDDLLDDLAKDKAIKNIAVVCPAFVADCLETIEEIGMEAQEQWLDLGGESFILVPCLNDSPAWVDAVVNMVKAG